MFVYTLKTTKFRLIYIAQKMKLYRTRQKMMT